MVHILSQQQPPLPTVLLSSDGNSLTEGDPTTRDLVLTRYGASGPLDVALQLTDAPQVDSLPLVYQDGGGTTLSYPFAAPGEDYTGLPPQTIVGTPTNGLRTYHETIPGGGDVQTLRVTLSVVNSTQAEGTEYAEFTLVKASPWTADPATYIIDPQHNAAIVPILDINAAPVDLVAVPITVVAGSSFDGEVATFKENPSLSSSQEYTASIDWGDNTEPSYVGAYLLYDLNGNPTVNGYVDGSHIYNQPGTYTVTTTIITSNSSATIVGTATVTTEPVTFNDAIGNAQVEGLPSITGELPLVNIDYGTFALYESRGDFQATVDWGDSTTSPGDIIFDNSRTGYTVAGDHNYTGEAGPTFPIHVTVAGVGARNFSLLASITFVGDAPAGALSITSVDFAGAGANALLKSGPANKPYSRAMPLGDIGSTVIVGPEWQKGQAGSPVFIDPVSYVKGSTPRLTVKVLVNNSLPADKVIWLKGFTTTGQPSTTWGSAIATGLPNETLTFTMDSATPLTNTNILSNSSLTYYWYVATAQTDQERDANRTLIRSTQNQVFLTVGKPSGMGFNQDLNSVSARRLDDLTRSILNAPDPATVIRQIATKEVSSRYFNSKRNFEPGADNFDPFSILDNPPAAANSGPIDGQGGDCSTLSILMKSSLDLLGIDPALSQRRLVYARTVTWDQTVGAAAAAQGLSSTESGFWQYAPQDVNHQKQLGFYSGGYNAWEACVVTNPGTASESWWMGGADVNGDNNPRTNDYDVLMRWTFPNNDTTFSHQAYFNGYTSYDAKQATFRDYPTLPMAKPLGLKQADAVKALNDAGFHNIQIVNVAGPVAGEIVSQAVDLGGNAITDQLQVNPHAVITLKVAQ